MVVKKRGQHRAISVLSETTLSGCNKDDFSSSGQGSLGQWVGVGVFSQRGKVCLAVSINHQVTKRPLRKCVIQQRTISEGAESNATQHPSSS